jgi:hypothetical protein
MEYATPEPRFAELGEEALDSVQPRGQSRREVEGDARVAAEPLDHLGMLVGSVCWRIDVEADDIAQLGREVRVVGQLELAQPVRLKAVRPPDALHRADADANHLGHRWRSPMSRLARRRLDRERHDAFGDLRASGGMRDGRVLSRSSLSTPSCMKRSCQRQTTVLATPVSRMISAVPQPLPVSNTIRARQACFCGPLRSPAMAAGRSRATTETVIPGCMVASTRASLSLAL